MGCSKKLKNGDIISWPCGNKKDGHVFNAGVTGGGYAARWQEESSEDRKKRKKRKKENKEEQKPNKYKGDAK